MFEGIEEDCKIMRAICKHDAQDVIWWTICSNTSDYTSHHGQRLKFFANCSDLFAWGGADLEEITEENLDVFNQSMDDCETACGHNCDGPQLFACRIRKMRPQGAAYPDEPKVWHLFDACGPERPTGHGNPRQRPIEAKDPEKDI